ncbi:hypothetical protein [Arthrobacter alpinus]|uniref:hypothetical protein n=1 Tax=Arthrobacter alpinus TaxID=656366 RepID=UPI00164526AF|nr:hypothetical protein [Arthrobacter alpinus]
MKPTADSRRTSVEAVIERWGNAARRKDLIHSGLTDWDLVQAVSSGRVLKVERAVFALPNASERDLHLAAHQAYLDCFSRAEQMGLWVLETPEATHVATAHGRPVPGCFVHRVRGRLTLWDVLTHCVQCGTDVEALCVLESAVVLKKCTLEQLHHNFQKRKDARARRIIAMIDPQSHSIAETSGRYHLRKAGYKVQGQAAIRGMGHLDLLVEGVLGIETAARNFTTQPKLGPKIYAAPTSLPSVVCQLCTSGPVMRCITPKP